MTAMTELFYRDPYVREFTSKVISCVEGEKGFEVMLEDTAFYPEGGGQPADHGTIDGAAVFDVRRTPAGIVHYCEKAFDVGQDVKGVLDWERRFDNMQNHTGEHVFSGIVNARFGFDNVGFHMDDDVITCDFSGVMTEEQVAEVERACNEAIVANVEVGISFPDAEALEKLAYRSKKALKGDVRIVDVPGCDRCACCGVHVRSTGEIGLIKVLSSMKHRGGTRVFFVCGIRALRDYEARIRETRAVSALLSAKPLEISSAVERVLAESAAKDARIAAMNRTIFDLKADADSRSGDAARRPGGRLHPFELRQFCVQLSEAKKAPFIAVMSETEPGVMSYVCAIPDDLLRPVSIALNKRLNGRGGGAKGFVQGSWKADETAVREAVAAVWAEHTA
ncbi:MAG: alanyl-tRNA editing protein [Sutterella wadsworthensis]